MAMASIFLAAKIEESCRRLRDVINVFQHLRQKRMGRLVEYVCCVCCVMVAVPISRREEQKWVWFRGRGWCNHIYHFVCVNVLYPFVDFIVVYLKTWKHCIGVCAIQSPCVYYAVCTSKKMR